MHHNRGIHTCEEREAPITPPLNDDASPPSVISEVQQVVAAPPPGPDKNKDVGTDARQRCAEEPDVPVTPPGTDVKTDSTQRYVKEPDITISLDGIESITAISHLSPVTLSAWNRQQQRSVS